MHDAKHDKSHTRPTRAASPPRFTRRQQTTSIASGLYVHDLPSIHVTKRDYRRLRSLLQTEGRATKAATLRFLARELDRALIYPAAEIPADAVTLDTWVVFRADVDERLECRALVYEKAHFTIGGTVLILTPLGVALLGLRAGNRMRYVEIDGRLRTASVESIASQPEAQERNLRHRYWPSPYADRALREGVPVAKRPDRDRPRRPSHSSKSARRERPTEASALSTPNDAAQSLALSEVHRAAR